MKLVFAIVQDDDAGDVIDVLTEKKYRITKLATTGGFLKSGNTTLLIGVEQDKVDDVIDVIKEQCKKREAVITPPSPMIGTSAPYVPYPVEVQVGGATVFVVDVDQFIRI